MSLLCSKNIKIISILIVLTIMSIVIVISISLINTPKLTSKLLNHDESIKCYHYQTNALQDISEVNPREGNSIFFHETSCSSYKHGKIVIKSRQACAVESAARLNPSYDVYLLYTSPGIFDFQGTQSDRYLRAILAYDNVKILHVDFNNYSKATPVQDLYQSGKIERSHYPKTDASDVIRYLTLRKYGGLYLDLDVIVLKSFENLTSNYAGAESDDFVGSSVLNFGRSGIGLNLSEKLLEDSKKYFNGYEFGQIGPVLITRLLRDICGAENAKIMLNKDCQGFKVYPQESFYSIPWWNWRMFVEEKYMDQIIDLTRNSYAVHFWNKFTSSSVIPVASKIPYALLAQKYCPKVFNECDKYF